MRRRRESCRSEADRRSREVKERIRSTDYRIMGAVLIAWERYLEAADAIGLDIAANLETAPSEVAVAATFRDNGMEVREDLVEYFSVLHSVAAIDADKVLIGLVALDVDRALVEHRELIAFAVEAAEGGDPELVYSWSRFPLASGKPTTMVDRLSGQVLEQWWDESEPRLIADSLAEWLDQKTAELQAGGLEVDHFARTVAGSAPIRLGVFEFGPAQFWLEKASVHVLVHDCSRVVVRHVAVGSSEASLGFERKQADLVASMLEANGVPRSAISFQVDGVADRAARYFRSNSVWLDGFR